MTDFAQLAVAELPPPISVIEPAWVDESWRHDGALEEMYLSMRGLQVWQQYRVFDTPGSLIMDLYMPTVWDDLVDGIHEVLAVLMSPRGYGSRERLATRIWSDVVAQIAPSRVHRFLQAGVTDDPRLIELLGADYEDDDAAMVLRLLGIMLTCMTNDNDSWLVNECAAIWFGLCDVALRAKRCEVPA